MKKVFIVGADMLIQRMFENREYTVAKTPKEADLVCFTGGADVSPDLYGDAVHPTTRSNPRRDQEEANLFTALPDDMPKVGICRGSQFLNVMSGGKLWQDVDRHAINNTHGVYYFEEGKYDLKKSYRQLNNIEQILCTSTHHQMMKPDQKKAEIWGCATRSTYRDTGRERCEESDFAYSPDVEIVYYPDTNSLCFQPHPEYGVESCENLFFKCVERAFG